jgi:ectoine hydroxylase-related dioxygenase (phytanoyl-CoA dioxygenase family)
MKDLCGIRAEFNQNGYVIVEDFFDDTQLQHILSGFNQLVSQQLHFLACQPLDSLEQNLLLLFKQDLTRYLNTIKAFSRIAAIHQAFNSEKFYQLLQLMQIQCPTIPTGPVVHLMSDQLKVPGGYFGQGAHQDWSSMYSSLNALTFWVALTDVGQTNFPLEVIPGSHLNGFIEGQATDHYFELDLTRYNSTLFQIVEVKAKSAVIFSPFLIHKTGLNSCAGFRLATSYRVDDSADLYHTEQGYYTAYTRSVNRTIDSSNRPTAELIKKQYTGIL